MHDVNYYQEKWGLTNCKKIAATDTSDVYRVSMDSKTPAVLKILNEEGLQFEKYGAPYLKHQNGHGAVELYKDDGQAQLLEYAGHYELREFHKNDNDLEVAEIAANVIKELHNSQKLLPEHQFKSLHDAFSIFLKSNDDAWPLISHAQNLFYGLMKDQAQPDLKVLHGDIHCENILKSDRGWIAIDAQPVYGDRHYECAMFFLLADKEKIFNIDYITSLEKIFCDVLNLNQERLRAFIYIHCIQAGCWCIHHNKDINITFELAQFIYDNNFEN